MKKGDFYRSEDIFPISSDLNPDKCTQKFPVKSKKQPVSRYRPFGGPDDFRKPAASPAVSLCVNYWLFKESTMALDHSNPPSASNLA